MTATHPHVIVAYNRDSKLLQLESGSVIVQDDMEHFITDGCTFVTRDPEGNQAHVYIVKMEDEQHLRTTPNKVTSDNINNLPTF